MEDYEQENIELRGTVAALQEEMERLSALVSSLVIAQNQPSSQVQATVISEITTTPILVAAVSAPLFTMPEGYPWGFNFAGYRHNVSGIQTTTTEIPTSQVSVSIP